MKTIITLASCISTFLLPGLITTKGETQSTTTTTTTTTTYLPTTTIVGTRVTDPQGVEIGQISNVVLDQETGCMAYVVLSTTESGRAVRSIAVPWSIFTPGADEHTYLVTVDRQKLESAPVWEGSRIDEYNRPEWVSRVYSYYGVRPGARMNVPASFAPQIERRPREEANTQSGPVSEQHRPARNNDMLMHRGRNNMMNQPGEHPSPSDDQKDVSHGAATSATPMSNPGDKPHQAASIPPSPSPAPSRGRAARRARRQEERAHPWATPGSSAVARRPARPEGAGRPRPEASATP
ncbi:MAG: PRC-barrel domain-containing protein [Chthoniobacterales bacterium]